MSDGSYTTKRMSDVSLELDRLEAQARLLRPLEAGVLRESGLLSSHRVLEIGCGPGFLTSLLCELASDGKVVATDTDPALLALCEERVRQKPRLGLETVLTRGADLPVADSSIDFSYLRFVLQHAPERLAILEQVHRALAVGGTVCVLDSDDGLVVQYPEDPFVRDVLASAREIQSTRGGDRLIGRKLSVHLNQIGFAQVRSRVLMFTTHEIEFPALARILFGFKSELSGRRGEIEKWIRETAPKVARGEYFLAAGVILCTGKKTG